MSDFNCLLPLFYMYAVILTFSLLEADLKLLYLAFPFIISLFKLIWCFSCGFINFYLQYIDIVQYMDTVSISYMYMKKCRQKCQYGTTLKSTLKSDLYSSYLKSCGTQVFVS